MVRENDDEGVPLPVPAPTVELRRQYPFVTFFPLDMSMTEDEESEDDVEDNVLLKPSANVPVE